MEPIGKTIKTWLIILTGSFYWSNFACAQESFTNLCGTKSTPPLNLSQQAIANQLGWVQTGENRCGGYYLEPPHLEVNPFIHTGQLKITSQGGLFSLHSTSTYEGNVVITKEDQELITNKAYVYRNPNTEKFSGIDLVGPVTFRQPESLITASCGFIDLTTDHKSLRNILYRMAIYNPLTSQKPAKIPPALLLEARKVFQLSAWGKAEEFKQVQDQVYEFTDATYSTCPPLLNTWKLQAEHITLDRDKGRGSANHAKLYVKNIPVLYVPYLNFPIDARRQSGFLWPTPGSSSTSGPFMALPYYWNMAPNYDDTITPTILGRRGLQINNLFRYLNETPRSEGQLEISILPHDRLFASFKENQTYEMDPVKQAELNRLENASTTRSSILWVNQTYFNEHWSGDVNFNYVSDDFYLQDFSNNLNLTTPNQLLQQADLYYKGQYWNFTTRIQGYQTLHPLDETDFYNQYLRLPEFRLDGLYEEPKTGLTYTTINEFTRFDIAKNPANKNPGDLPKQPIGDRIHVQPGIIFPYTLPYFYINPRLQFAMTKYDVHHTLYDNSEYPHRVLPIFDVNSGLFFEREASIFYRNMIQTLEPQVYYTYIPYRNQSEIPVFDTVENTLTYDQLFIYNRFSSWDRIGDANQLAAGITTRLIDRDTGLQKASASIGQIFYFANRRVTLCQTGDNCDDIPLPANNTMSRSPLSATLGYNLSPRWSIGSNTIWNSQNNHLDNQTVTIQYIKDPHRVISLSYAYVRNSDDLLSEISANNLSQTDLSFSWPISRDWSTIGRWTEDWNHTRFHNLLYGLQYDTCCWAIRFVAGRTFDSLIKNNSYQYNTEFFIQFALKGLGSFGSGNPGSALNNAVIASEAKFGQDY